MPRISLFHKQLSTDFTCNITQLKRILVCACVIRVCECERLWKHKDAGIDIPVLSAG